MKFSVVIPVYNRASKISRTIESVRAQTYEDWEVVIVDDGSSDYLELDRVVKGFNDDRIRLISQENGGGGKARNRGIEESKGEYIALLDSDDVFYENKLQVFFEYISDIDDPERILFFSRFVADRGDGKTWIKPDRLPSTDERIDEYLTCTSGWIQTSTMVLSRAFAGEIRFSEDLPSSQDTDFAIRCWLSGGKVVSLPMELVSMDDVYDPNRVSKQKKLSPLLSWVTTLHEKGASDRAIRGYKGWQCARIASSVSKFQAYRFYLPALVHGCFSWKDSIRVFLQISLSESNYHRLVDFILGLKK